MTELAVDKTHVISDVKKPGYLDKLVNFLSNDAKRTWQDIKKVGKFIADDAIQTYDDIKNLPKTIKENGRAITLYTLIAASPFIAGCTGAKVKDSHFENTKPAAVLDIEKPELPKGWSLDPHIAYSDFNEHVGKNPTVEQLNSINLDEDEGNKEISKYEFDLWVQREGKAETEDEAEETEGGDNPNKTKNPSKGLDSETAEEYNERLKGYASQIGEISKANPFLGEQYNKLLDTYEKKHGINGVKDLLEEVASQDGDLSGVTVEDLKTTLASYNFETEPDEDNAEDSDNTGEKDSVENRVEEKEKIEEKPAKEPTVEYGGSLYSNESFAGDKDKTDATYGASISFKDAKEGEWEAKIDVIDNIIEDEITGKNIKEGSIESERPEARIRVDIGENFYGEVQATNLPEDSTRHRVTESVNTTATETITDTQDITDTEPKNINYQYILKGGFEGDGWFVEGAAKMGHHALLTQGTGKRVAENHSTGQIDEFEYDIDIENETDIRGLQVRGGGLFKEGIGLDLLASKEWRDTIRNGEDILSSNELTLGADLKLDVIDLDIGMAYALMENKDLISDATEKLREYSLNINYLPKFGAINVGKGRITDSPEDALIDNYRFTNGYDDFWNFQLLWNTNLDKETKRDLLNSQSRYSLNAYDKATLPLLKQWDNYFNLQDIVRGTDLEGKDSAWSWYLNGHERANEEQTNNEHSIYTTLHFIKEYTNDRWAIGPCLLKDEFVDMPLGVNLVWLNKRNGLSFITEAGRAKTEGKEDKSYRAAVGLSVPLGGE